MPTFVPPDPGIDAARAVPRWTHPAAPDPVGATDVAALPRETDWNLDGFDDLIDRRGLDCDAYPTTVCPCLRERGEQPRWACPFCHGSGDRLGTAVRIRALLTRASSTQDPAGQTGFVEEGEGVVTFKSSALVPNEGTRFVFVGNAGRRRYQQVLRRGLMQGNVPAPRDLLHFNFGIVLASARTYSAEAYAELLLVEDALRRGGLAEARDREALYRRRREAIARADIDASGLLAVVARGGVAMVEWHDDRIRPGQAVAVEYDHQDEYTARGATDAPDHDVDFLIVRHLKVLRRDAFLMRLSEPGPGAVPEGIVEDVP